MTQDEIIEMARQAGWPDVYTEWAKSDWSSIKGLIVPMTLEQLVHCAKLVAAKEREAIQDEYWICVNSDLENGVKSLNEKAAERFTTYFPELSKFGSWLEARGEA